MQRAQWGLSISYVFGEEGASHGCEGGVRGRRGHEYSRIVDPEKKAYLVKNKNPSVIWILNDQNSSKWSLEGS